MNGEKRNFNAFLWHALLLSVTVTFTEINTILPSMIIQVGGNEMHIGFLTAIMIGLPLAAQLFFAGFLHTRKSKKPYLLAGINLRVLALTAIAFILLNLSSLTPLVALMLIYAGLILFTLSGAFAGVPYIDLLGKSFSGDLRKKFFLKRQLISSGGILVSALTARYILSSFSMPRNYFILFISAAFILFIASGGFWFIKEEPQKQTLSALGFTETIKKIPSLIKKDSNLKNYIIIRNLIGLTTAALPFYVSLAKSSYYLDKTLTGNLLLLQIAGMVIGNLLWSRVVKNRGFKGILYIWALSAALLPFMAVFIVKYLSLSFFLPLFILMGMIIGAQKVAADAVLIEISNENNRALYSGITGTLNLSLALFPIIIGSLLSFTGYTPVLITVGLMALLCLYFIKRLICPADRNQIL